MTWPEAFMWSVCVLVAGAVITVFLILTYMAGGRSGEADIKEVETHENHNRPI